MFYKKNTYLCKINSKTNIHPSKKEGIALSDKLADRLKKKDVGLINATNLILFFYVRTKCSCHPLTGMSGCIFRQYTFSLNEKRH